MLRKRLGLAALVCVAAWHNWAAAWDKGEPTDNTETTIVGRLQGSWAMVSVEFRGMKMDIPKGQGRANASNFLQIGSAGQSFRKKIRVYRRQFAFASHAFLARMLLEQTERHLSQ